MEKISLTILRDGDQHKDIVAWLRTVRGLPHEHGADLKAFISHFGTRVDVKVKRPAGSVSESPPCLAAQLVAHLKTGAGVVYLLPADARKVGEHYTYRLTLYAREPADLVIIEAHRKPVYSGPVGEFPTDQYAVSSAASQR